MNTKTVVMCIVYTANLNSNNVNIVSSQENNLVLPHLDLSSLNPKKQDISLNNLIRVLFEKSVNLNFSWTKPKFLNVELIHDEESNTIITGIYYAIYIPENTQLINNSYWIDIKPYVPYYEILRKLVCML